MLFLGQRNQAPKENQWSLWVLWAWYSRILWFCEHDLIPVQVLTVHSSLPNPGMIPYSACLLLMLVAVWPWPGLALCSTLARFILLEENYVLAPSFKDAIYLAQWQSLHFHFTCCSLFPGRLFKQLLQILFALCLGNRSFLSKGFQCLVVLFLVANLVKWGLQC